MDARHLERRARVDAGDVGMGMRRAHDSGMELIGEFEIVEKAGPAPATGEDPRVVTPIVRSQIHP